MTRVPLTPLEKAQKKQAKRILDLQKRERLRPALELFDTKLKTLRDARDPTPEITAFMYITDIFRASYGEVRKQISGAGKTGINETNAIKRSAGTNFQGLCEYAVLSWLKTTKLPLNVGPNVPKHLKDQLTIQITDGAGKFSVSPDIDICLWKEGGAPTEPLLFLSAKTSLVDRAGQAARWKLYLDLQQTTCPHREQVTDCPSHRTRVEIPTEHSIVYAIVTANIYKTETSQPEGELRSGQCRNNTFMFQHKYTTRNDATEFRPPDWQSFSEFPNLVTKVFSTTVLNKQLSHV